MRVRIGSSGSRLHIVDVGSGSLPPGRVITNWEADSLCVNSRTIVSVRRGPSAFGRLVLRPSVLLRQKREFRFEHPVRHYLAALDQTEFIGSIIRSGIVQRAQMQAFSKQQSVRPPFQALSFAEQVRPLQLCSSLRFYVCHRRITLDKATPAIAAPILPRA